MKQILIRTLLVLLLCVAPSVAAEPIDAARAIQATAPGAFFVLGEPLSFDWKIPGETSYVVQDAYGTPVLRGTAQTGNVTLPALACGYYRIIPAANGTAFVNSRSFAVVPPRVKIEEGKRSPYAIDTADCDWLCQTMPEKHSAAFPHSGYPVMEEMADRIGLFCGRNRQGWPEQEPGKVNWGGLLAHTQALGKRGITLAGMIESSPDWARKDCKTPRVPRRNLDNRQLPADLRSVYNYLRESARSFGPALQYCEFWNEPDLRPDTVWEYSAAAKAAYLGLKAENPSGMVLSGSFGHEYFLECAKNGISDYIDIFNTHIYSGLAKYPEILGECRRALAQAGTPDKMVFITECAGWSIEGEANQPSYYKSARAHSPEQEMIQAEFAIKSQILMQSYGAGMTFSFVMPAYNERGGKKDWGMFRADYTGKPVLCAFANLTANLAAADYAGRYNPAPGTSGFLYRKPGGVQTLAIWAQTRVDKEEGPVPYQSVEKSIQIAVPDQEYVWTDAFGTARKLKAENGQLTLMIRNLPGYLTGRMDLTPQEKSPVPAVAGAQSPADLDKSIVFRILTGEGFHLPDISQRFAVLDGDSGRFCLQIYNFDQQQEKSGTVRIRGGSVSGIPDRVAIPAGGMVEYQVSYTPDTGSSSATILADGVFGGKKTAPCAVPLRIAKALKELPVPEMCDAANWKENSANKMTLQMLSGNIVQVDAFLPGAPANSSNHWVYPELMLKNGLPPQTVGIRFELQLDESILRNGAYDSVVYVCEALKGAGQMLWYTLPKDGDWHAVTVLFPPKSETMDNVSSSAVIHPENVKKIRIGMNPKADKSIYRLRNIRALTE